MSLTDKIDRVVFQAFEAAGYDAKNARAVRSQRAELADYQSNGAMAAAKLAGKPPRVIADDIAARLKAHTDLFADVTVAGPGFINLKLNDEWISDEAASLLGDPRQGYDPASHKPRRVVIDFSGPNIAKEMHAGHLRSTILGESLQRILRLAGDTVISDAHFGDWGTPMGMIIAELAHEQPDLSYFDSAVTSDYPAERPIDIEELSALYRRASTRNKENEDARKISRDATLDLQNRRPGYIALWDHFRMVTFKAIGLNYERLGIHFDLWYGESNTADLQKEIVEELRERGIAIESQGALVIPVEENKPPLILVKSDGGYIYGTFDLATVLDRVRSLQPDVIVYVVDIRQAQHFSQVFKAADITGYAPGVEFVHAANGTINGKDGKPFKTREGGVIRLEELLDLGHAKAMEELPAISEAGLSAEALSKLAEQISIAAIKFQDLKNNRASDYIFDVDSFTKFEGKTGPYLQYAIVRCNAILAKADALTSPSTGEVDSSKRSEELAGEGADFNLTPSPNPLPLGRGLIMITNASERALILELLAFPTALKAAVAGYEPSIIADHAYNVAQTYSSFYASSHVLNETDAALRDSRLRLVAIVKQHLTLCLNLLGIEAPEMMPNRRSL